MECENEGYRHDTDGNRDWGQTRSANLFTERLQSGNWGNKHMSLSCASNVQVFFPPSKSMLFIPKILDINESGSYRKPKIREVSRVVPLNEATYEDNSDDGKHHDRSTLTDGLFSLIHRLPRLDDTSLLLFQRQQIIHLSSVSISRRPGSLFFTTSATHTLGGTFSTLPQPLELVDSISDFGLKILCLHAKPVEMILPSPPVT